VIFLVKLRRLGSGQPGARAGTASSPAGRVRIWGGTYFPATNMVDEMLGVFLEIRKTAWFLLFVLSLSKFFWLEFARFKFSRDFLGNNYHVDLVKLEIGDSADVLEDDRND